MTPQERKVIELALEALENSVDLVVDDAYNAEQLYGNYPTRQGKVDGLKVLAKQHKQAITAIKEALAQPEQDQDEVDIRSRLYQRIHELETQLAQPEQEPVVLKLGECWPENVMQMWDYYRKEIANGNTGSEPRDWFESLAEMRLVDTAPPQRKPLTDEEISEYAERMEASDPTDSFWREFARAIEAAHGIKE